MITVSIVSGRNSDYFKSCLSSLQKASVGIPLHLVVVDNASPWDVRAATLEFFPNAEIMTNSSLQGFGANHNQALIRRIDDFALVLNDDLELHVDSLRLMLDFATVHPKAAVIGPLLYPGSWSDSPISCGGKLQERVPRPIQGMVLLILRLLFGGLVISEFLKARDKKSSPENILRSYVSGACCLVRRDFIELHGLYDSEFYMYYEDIDLGRRARETSWECWQVGAAKVMHVGGGSFNDKTWQWFSASALRFARKHHGPGTLFLTQALIAMFKSLYSVKGWICGKK